MVEWLKELSLFDHFLHGLFKYLNEDSRKADILSGKIGKRMFCFFPS